MLPSSLMWLNAEFMQKVLRNSENDDTIEVTNMTTKFTTANGDHYFSDIIRAGVEYSCNKSDDHTSSGKKSLIIKVSPTLEDARKKLISDSGVFEIEIKMMGTTLVKMNELLGEEGYRLNARALYTNTGDPSLLVIEDLGPLGYRMADRRVGLDLDHCILVMRGLAKFHASSVALYEKDPKVAEYRHDVFHSKVPEQLETFFINGLRAFANEIRDWPELESRCSFSEKFLKLSDVFFKKGCECYNPKDDEFNVLNHGDCWSTNMLFRYNDENKVTDHIFVDFQMCSWSTPLMDILMFMNSSTTEDVELYHQDVLLEEYLKKLTETMSRIGCKTEAPKMSVFKKIVPGHEIMSVLAACVGFPLMFTKPSRSKSVDQVYQQSDVDFDTAVYKEPEYRRRMVRRLHAWNANGLFDV